jgi:hypothetical protein
MTKQSENGSEVNAPQTNISASESGVSSEVKTPENKPSEGLLKGVELLLAIIGIVKLVIDLLKKGSKDSEAFTQIQASNQNIPPEILQNIIKKTADIFANANTEKNLTGAEESKDPVKELQSKILESLGLDPKKIGAEGDNEFQEALKKFIKILEKPGDKENGDIKPPATEGSKEGVKDLKDPNAVGKEVGVEGNKAIEKSSESGKVIGTKKEPEPKQTPTNPLNKEASHVERLQTQRQQGGNEKSGGGGRG